MIDDASAMTTAPSQLFAPAACPLHVLLQRGFGWNQREWSGTGRDDEFWQFKAL